MLFKNLPVFVLSLFTLSLSGQTNLDSLLQVWNDENTADTIRADAYLSYIHNYYIFQKPDSAVFHLQQLHAFCQAQNIQDNVVDVKRTEGYHYFRIGQYANAIKSYDEGLVIAERNQYLLGIADILLRKGWLYHDNGQKTKAIGHYQKSLNYYKTLNDNHGLKSVYNELGSIYRDEEDYEKSINYYKKALEKSENRNLDIENIAVFSNMGNLFSIMGKHDSALVYLHQVLKFDIALNDKLAICSDYMYLGATYREKGNNLKALNYYTKGLKLSEEINDEQRTIHSLLELAEFDLENKAYKAAIEKCKVSFTKAQALKDLDDQVAACDCLYRVNKAIGNGAIALAYLEQVEQLEDSLKLKETTTQLLQMEFATKQKSDSLLQVKNNLEVTQNHQEELALKERNRNIAIISGLFSLLLAFGFFIRYRTVQSSKQTLQKEKDRSESILLNILPAEVAEELKLKGKIEPRNFDEVSILFTDFKSFTKNAASVPPQLLLAEINECFAAFDHICTKYNIEKIKTIGDAYMAAGGLPVPSQMAIKNTVLAGLEMQAFITNRLINQKGQIPFEMRVGIHTGLITAGIVGIKKIQYDLWGDTVNTASRIETAGQINKVNISKATYLKIKDDPQLTFEDRGTIEVKGKGLMNMYFVSLN